MTVTVIAWLVSVLVGWFGGYCYGWTKGENDAERRWADAVGRAGHR